MSTVIGDLKHAFTGKSLFYPKRVTVVTPKPTLCGQCRKPVFAAETVSAAGKKYHTMCLKCSNCSRLLDSKTLTEHKNVLFCHPCYSKSFGIEALRSPSTLTLTNAESNSKIYQSVHNWPPAVEDRRPSFPHYAGMAGQAQKELPTVIDYRDDLKVTSVTQKILGAQQSEVCARCKRRVYIAERVTMAGRAYHKLCFRCSECGSSLSAGQCCDNRKGDIFCKSCYTKRFGPVGVGRGIQNRANDISNVEPRS